MASVPAMHTMALLSIVTLCACGRVVSGAMSVTHPYGAGSAIAPAPSAATSTYTQGTYINCGGPAFTGTFANWQADTYVSGGETFMSNLSATFASSFDMDAALYETIRFFGGQDPAVNSYSIPVSVPGYYYVRLYFAEILYTSTVARRFNVTIEGMPVLTAFEVPGLMEGVVKEFFVPVTDASADISFIRGAIGDPMISGISVTAAPTGMYNLSISSGIMLSAIYRISAGQGSSYVDDAGRVWAADTDHSHYSPPDLYALPKLPEYLNGSDGAVGFASYPLHSINYTTPASSLAAYVSTSQYPTGYNVAPEVLPAQAYFSYRQTDASQTFNNASYPQGPFVSLTYTLPVEMNTLYLLRLGWLPLIEFAAATVNHHTQKVLFPVKGGIIMNVTVNYVQWLSSLDVYAEVHAATTTSPLLKSLYVHSDATGNLSISISPVFNPATSFSKNVWINSIEVLKVEQNVSTAVQGTQPATQPGGESETSHSSHLWQGVGIGIALGVVVAVSLLGAFFICLPHHRRSRRARHEEVVYGKGGKSGKNHSGQLSHLMRSPSKGSAGDFDSFSGSSFEGKLKGQGANGMRPGLFGTQVFTLDEIAAATDGFGKEAILGYGGFGIVYKACLGSGEMVAVKRLHASSQQGEREFVTEVELLNRLHHRYLVNLLGYCDQEQQLMLVYEYVPNGTLRDHLRDEEKASALSWPARLRIALGAARGLEYLHRGASPPVIHRDIKTSNILLDFNFDSKVADFGLSKLGRPGPEDSKNEAHVSTMVKGTMGYLDPAYYQKQQLTDKSDVYSFGVVLLELLTGRLPVWIADEDTQDADGPHLVHLVDWVAPFLHAPDVSTIVALQLDSSGPFLPSMTCFAHVARRCVDEQSKLRPSMAEVVRELEDAKKLLDGAPTTTGPTKPDLESSFAKAPHSSGAAALPAPHASRNTSVAADLGSESDPLAASFISA